MMTEYHTDGFTGHGFSNRPNVEMDDAVFDYAPSLGAAYVTHNHNVQHVSYSGQSASHEQSFSSSSPPHHPRDTQPQPYAASMHFATFPSSNTIIPQSNAPPTSCQSYANLNSGAPETTPPYEIDNFDGTTMPGSNKAYGIAANNNS
jgi:hypothetical protein